MADEKQLLEQLTRVKSAEKEKERLIAEAARKAGKRVAEANAEAKRIIQKARAEAEAIEQETINRGQRGIAEEEEKITGNAKSEAEKISAMGFPGAAMKRALEKLWK